MTSEHAPEAHDDGLIPLAIEHRKHAYCPYSRYAVGAAVGTEDGWMFGGSNVENASYGLSMCAERAAIFAMVSEGARRISEIAVATPDGGPPCGACLQVMREFTDDPATLDIYLVNEAGEVTQTTLAALLPSGFTANFRDSVDA